MISESVVALSRWQFALTAMYHFIFVPLTLGLTFILAIMETTYVVTGKEIYKDMVKYWGKLFGINFALGVTTGITLEFQFGTNWAYYSHYVGDIFGAPLAIEGLMAFFLESTFIGLFFFGWNRLSKGQHLMVTWLVALGSNLSAIWILIANGWMQFPTGAEFNFETMRMEMTSFADIVFSPVAQTKFVHTVSAGYTTGAMFVLAISSYFLLKKRDIGFAKRSFAIAAAFGFVAICSVIILGDEAGVEAGRIQPIKLAALEAEWNTQTAPASLTLIGLPNEQKARTDYAVDIPWVLGLLVTRSIDTPIKGINDIKIENKNRIINGMQAYSLLQTLKSPGGRTPENIEAFKTVKQDLGYGLLLKKYTPQVTNATEEQIISAVNDSVPKVAPMFWSFRLMVGLGFTMLLVFAAALHASIKGRIGEKPWLLKTALLALPIPWIACELGWFIAEYGRQPWTINDVLPTHISTSTLSTGDLTGSLIAFVGFYTILLIAEMYLMVRFAKRGPSVLGTGKYHFETQE